MGSLLEDSGPAKGYPGSKDQTNLVKVADANFGHSVVTSNTFLDRFCLQVLVLAVTG